MKKLLLLSLLVLSFGSLHAQSGCFAGTFPQTQGSDPRPYLFTAALNGDMGDGNSTGDTTIALMIDEAAYSGDTVGFSLNNEAMIMGEGSHPIASVTLDTVLGLPDSIVLGFNSANSTDANPNGSPAGIYTNANPSTQTFTDQTGSNNEGPTFCVSITGTPDLEDVSPTTGPDTVANRFGLVLTLDMPIAPSGGFTDTVYIAYSIVFPEVVSRNDHLPLEALTFSPNPAADVLNVSFSNSSAQHVRFEVYDLQGRLLQTQELALVQAGTHQHAVNISELPSGIYILQSTANGVRQTERFIKR